MQTLFAGIEWPISMSHTSLYDKTVTPACFGAGVWYLSQVIAVSDHFAYRASLLSDAAISDFQLDAEVATSKIFRGHQ